ncbi:MAG: acetyl-CoA carboxylase biotin carboxyl carrier protein [Eubacteriales bacterium SKADARSKE-1]|nr:acetyl-CoA carboxylase biotin carboxyl carrier protein [Eubacteriales bacterium SKADARSKE-1]
MNKAEKDAKISEDVKKLKQLADVLNKYNLSAVELLDDTKKYRVEKGANKNNGSDNTTLEQKELCTIMSPMVGVFYDTEYMNKGNIVKEGQKFKKGDTLCVLEAMKTFTEIQAKEDGEITEVCAKNGDIIEYSQPLFKYSKI